MRPIYKLSFDCYLQFYVCLYKFFVFKSQKILINFPAFFLAPEMDRNFKTIRVFFLLYVLISMGRSVKVTGRKSFRVNLYIIYCPTAGARSSTTICKANFLRRCGRMSRKMRVYTKYRKSDIYYGPSITQKPFDRAV